MVVSGSARSVVSQIGDAASHCTGAATIPQRGGAGEEVAERRLGDGLVVEVLRVGGRRRAEPQNSGEGTAMALYRVAPSLLAHVMRSLTNPQHPPPSVAHGSTIAQSATTRA